jgi:hypothetical protein
MRNVVIIRLRVYLLKDIWKIPLILEVNPVRDSKGRSKSKKNVQCYYCKKYGHYKSKCPKLKNKEEGDKLSSSSMAGVVEANFRGSEFVLTVTVSDGHFSDK